MGKWSEEAIQRNRRKRKAMRAFKKNPLIAWLDFKDLYSGDYETFWRDANRQPKYRKKGKKLSQKQRWGKEVLQSILIRILDGNPVGYSEIERAKRLLSPGDYELGIKIENQYKKVFIPNKLPKEMILEFQQGISKVKTKEEAEKFITEFRDKTRLW